MNFARKLVLECTYIKDEKAHTKFYYEGENALARREFKMIRDKHPEYPIRVLGISNGKKVDYRKGPEYDFDSLALTVDVETETGGQITYLCHKVKFGSFSVVMSTRKGDVVRGCKVIRNTRRTEEQMMNQRNEGNFDRHRFIEDVII